MAETKLPGRSFAYMANLLNVNFQVLTPTPFGTELMLAIFWEETLFNNIFQTGSGNGVGFGQAEPAEFYRFDANGSQSQLAREKGYLVHNLPPRNGKKLTAPLDDFTSVKVPCAFVRDLFERGIKSKQSILNAYGGVGFKGPQPAHLAKEGGREAIIQGMLNSESALKKAETPDEIMKALKLSRGFDHDDEFREILFPEYEVLEFD
jgi:hypothetical protein